MHNRFIFTGLILVIVAVVSCRKPKHFPDEPVIVFKDFTTTRNAQGLDISGHITVSFTDGDGDIGLRSGDTLAPYDTCSVFQYNYFIKIFEKRNGTFRQFVFKKNFAPCMNVDLYNVCLASNPALSPTLDSTYNARLRDITPEGKSKTLEGDLDLELPFLIPCVSNDTVKFQLYLYDRALHKSNVVESPEYIISTQ